MGRNYYDGDEMALADILVEMGRGPFRWIGDIVDANGRAGNHFFDASAMRFFDSRKLTDTYFGRLFITSERFDDNTPRLYTIRIANDDGAIASIYPEPRVLEFQAHDSASVAKRIARNAAALASSRMAPA